MLAVQVDEGRAWFEPGGEDVRVSAKRLGVRRDVLQFGSQIFEIADRVFPLLSFKLEYVIDLPTPGDQGTDINTRSNVDVGIACQNPESLTQGDLHVTVHAFVDESARNNNQYLVCAVLIEPKVLKQVRKKLNNLLLPGQRNVLMVWRRRFIADRWVWELPGGYVDPDEDPAITAAQEVEEEICWRLLRMAPSTSAMHPTSTRPSGWRGFRSTRCVTAWRQASGCCTCSRSRTDRLYARRRQPCVGHPTVERADLDRRADRCEPAPAA